MDTGYLYLMNTTSPAAKTECFHSWTAAAADAKCKNCPVTRAERDAELAARADKAKGRRKPNYGKDQTLGSQEARNADNERRRARYRATAR